MQKTELKKQQGFTLIEILVVIGMIALLAAIVIVAINPARQFAQGRNTQRTSNVNTILNSIGQRMADNKGLFRQTTDITCTSAMEIPSSADSETDAVNICGDGSAVTCAAADIDMRPCLVPTYVSELPVDPSSGTACDDAACGGGYNTGYKVYKDSNGRITVFAPTANTTSELDQIISVTR